jgi:hypothetical protein
VAAAGTVIVSGGTPARWHRGVERVEEVGLVADVVQQVLREVAAEAVAADDAHHRLALELARERIRGDEPSLDAQPLGEVVQRPLVRVARLQPPGEHGDVAAVGEELEGVDLAHLVGQVARDILRRLLDRGVAGTAQAEEAVVLQEHLRAGS